MHVHVRAQLCEGEGEKGVKKNQICQQKKNGKKTECKPLVLEISYTASDCRERTCPVLYD